MDIAAYLDQHPSPVAANREMALLSTVFSFAIRWSWCEHNPTKGVRRNKEKPRDRYITDDELVLIRSHADSQWQCIIDIAYLTAIRQGDIMRLRLSVSTVTLYLSVRADREKDGLYHCLCVG